MNLSNTPNVNYLCEEIIEMIAEYLPAIFPAFAILFTAYICVRLLMMFTKLY